MILVRLALHHSACTFVQVLLCQLTLPVPGGRMTITMQRRA